MAHAIHARQVLENLADAYSPRYNTHQLFVNLSLKKFNMNNWWKF